MLGVSIVTYRVDEGLLYKVLLSLFDAIENLPSGIKTEFVKIIDNGNEKEKLEGIIRRLQSKEPAIEVVKVNQNIGYGRAHNLAILTSNNKYHLVLNPDVILDQYCLKAGLQFLEEHSYVSGVAPHVVDQQGEIQYICKAYPSVFDLFLRGFTPKAFQELFTRRLSLYEQRELVELNRPARMELISGCFMLCRTEALKDAGGFDPKYFLYFEDYALSMELNKAGSLYYLPAMKIIHHGGNAAKKGLNHIFMFIKSSFIFFNTYGWKFY